MAQALERVDVDEISRRKAAIPKNRTRLSSVANSLRLIKAFSEDRYEIGISDLAKRLGLAKSTVHRLASTLLEQGMLEQNPADGKYRLGLALFELGTLVRRKMDFTVEARPFLRTLMEKTGETVHLAILDRDSVLYIITHESKQALRMGSKVGTRVPVHATAVGKTLLAFQPEEEIERIIALGLPASAPNTVVDPKPLRRELALVRARNYAVDDEESEVGLRSIAAPIRSHSGNVVAAISIAGPVHRMTKKMLLGWVRELVEVADAVSRRLGWQASRTEIPHRLVRN
jgi:DNA-binding IclR family transcriptional regulator